MFVLGFGIGAVMQVLVIAVQNAVDFTQLGAIGTDPSAVAQLLPAIQAGYIDAYAASLQTVFLLAVPIALFAFALTWLLPEVPLPTTTRPSDPVESIVHCEHVARGEESTAIKLDSCPRSRARRVLRDPDQSTLDRVIGSVVVSMLCERNT